VQGRISKAALIAALAGALALACFAQARGGYYLSHHPPTGKSKKAVVITLHGGGWKGNFGAASDEIMATFIDDLSNWGYRVYNLAYREGRELEDTYKTVDRLAKKYPTQPLCVLGGSSGGHLALMAAIARPEEVDCVVDIGGPINFVQPEDRPNWEAIRNRAIEVFGAQRLRKVSPALQTRKIDASVLVVSAECDYYTSIERQREFVRSLHQSKLLPLAYDPAGYDLGGHCPVGLSEIEKMRDTEKRFLARYAK
jgi:pimeloyl-ACP methyl ester carboxylesterase